MQIDNSMLHKLMSKDLMDLFIRIGLLTLFAVLCARIFAPFAGLLLWGLILAVALYPLHQRFVKGCNGRQGRAATLLVLAGLFLIGIPTALLGDSLARHVYDIYSAFQNNAISVKQPDPAVARWPFIGEKIYSVWSMAVTNLPAFLKGIQAHLINVSKQVVSFTADSAGGMIQFLGSLIIAGIIMAHAESGVSALQRITCRLTGPIKGPRMLSLSTATIRSVATGIIGVAIIQALLLGIGFIMAGIPAAGVLALIVLLLGIMQLPAAIISIPAIGYLWWSGDASTVSNIIASFYLMAAGMVDNILKPLLLGRGVDAPMPIILLGALGGMISDGIIGLFIGSTVLAVGYQIFMEWVDEGSESTMPT